MTSTIQGRDGMEMATGVYLTFFGSFVFGTNCFPLSDVPLQQIAQQAAAGLPLRRNPGPGLTPALSNQGEF